MQMILLIRGSCLVIAVVALVLSAASIVPGLAETEFDDSYMFLRYAKHWLSGDGFSWNVEDGTVYGITSITHLLVITAVRGLTDFPDTLVLTSVSLAAGLASVAVLIGIGFVFFPALRNTWLPLLAVPCIVLAFPFRYHSQTGMETTLAILFNSVFIGCILLLERRRTIARLLLCAVVAYGCFLTRPDMGVYCLLLPGLFLLAGNWRHWRWAIAYSLVFVGLLCLDLLWKQAAFGDLLPLSYYAKSAGFYRGYIGSYKWNAADYTYNFFRGSLFFVLVIVYCTTRQSAPKIAAIGIPFFLTVSYYATVTQIMGSVSRYYYPSLPFLVLGAFVALEGFLRPTATQQKNPAQRELSTEGELSARGELSEQSVPQATSQRGPQAAGSSRVSLWRTLVLIGLVFFFTSPEVERRLIAAWRDWAIGEPPHFRTKYPYKTPSGGVLPTLGWWESILAMNSLLKKMPSDVAIASSEYGYLGSEHPKLTIIDLVGLHDRTIAHEGFSTEYLLSRRPDLLWMPHSDYTFATKEILDSDDFASNYTFYPTAYDYGLAVHKHSPFAAAIEKVLKQEFSRTYPGRTLADYQADWPVRP